MPIDYSKYPPNWKTEIVPAVLKRANNCCEWCGLENKQIVHAIKLRIRDNEGKYKFQTLWFRSQEDAIRESRGEGFTYKKVVLTVAHLDHDELNHEVELS